jgi:hypothetical protein
VDAGAERRSDGCMRPRPQDRVLGDQRPVEVAGDRVDAAGEILRKVQPCGFVRKSTSAVRSLSGSDLYDFGMTPFG